LHSAKFIESTDICEVSVRRAAHVLQAMSAVFRGGELQQARVGPAGLSILLEFLVGFTTKTDPSSTTMTCVEQLIPKAEFQLVELTAFFLHHTFCLPSSPVKLLKKFVLACKCRLLFSIFITSLTDTVSSLQTSSDVLQHPLVWHCRCTALALSTVLLVCACAQPY
jgi:hypothetical protein